MQMYYVYILQSKVDSSYYTGTIQNLKERIKEHDWHMAKYSSKKAPFELVWFCGFVRKEKAFQFERYLKSGSGFAFSRKRLV